MSWLSWFSRKPLPKRASASDVAAHTAAAGPGRADAAAKPENAKFLKNERMERREWLYSVVRESMLHAGVLTASFKFKVLALDERGRQFLVMVDLAPQLGGDTGRLSKIETQIIQTAKTRYDLVITAVYWRTNDHVAVGLPGAAQTPRVFASEPAPLAKAPAPAAFVAPAKPSGRFEPIQADEVAAFKKALAAAGQSPAAEAGQMRRSGPRSRPSASGYEDTEMQEPESRPDALSATQYGELR